MYTDPGCSRAHAHLPVAPDFRAETAKAAAREFRARKVIRQLSFLDPDGFVIKAGERIFRVVLPHAGNNLQKFLSSEFAGNGMAAGTLPHTQVLGAGSGDELPELPASALVLEHRPIDFPGYPCEWSPAMLHAAASLTLDLARDAPQSGYRLKDATPYNVMFEGAKPVFIDILSFEPDDSLDAVWRPYAQFVRTFIYPLLASRYFGLPLNETMLVNREGLEPERLMRLCSPLQPLRQPFLGSVTLPTLLSRHRNETSNHFRPRMARDAGEASFLRNRLLKRARRLLDRSAPVAR